MQVIAKEEEQGIWGFKALKQMMKLLFSMSEFKDFTECYTRLLGEAGCSSDSFVAFCRRAAKPSLSPVPVKQYPTYSIIRVPPRPWCAYPPLPIVPSRTRCVPNSTNGIGGLSPW